MSGRAKREAIARAVKDFKSKAITIDEYYARMRALKLSRAEAEMHLDGST
jgi:hypothetical protein